MVTRKTIVTLVTKVITISLVIKLHIVCHGPELACKKYRTWSSMFLRPSDLQKLRLGSLLSLVANTRLGLISSPCTTNEMVQWNSSDLDTVIEPLVTLTTTTSKLGLHVKCYLCPILTKLKVKNVPSIRFQENLSRKSRFASLRRNDGTDTTKLLVDFRIRF
jgi:hypothetical protein